MYLEFSSFACIIFLFGVFRLPTFFDIQYGYRCSSAYGALHITDFTVFSYVGVGRGAGAALLDGLRVLIFSFFSHTRQSSVSRRQTSRHRLSQFTLSQSHSQRVLQLHTGESHGDAGVSVTVQRLKYQHFRLSVSWHVPRR